MNLKEENVKILKEVKNLYSQFDMYERIFIKENSKRNVGINTMENTLNRSIIPVYIFINASVKKSSYKDCEIYLQ